MNEVYRQIFSMELIVITSPKPVEAEQHVCCQLFERGLQTLHLRKPAAGIAEWRRWLQVIPAQFHPRIMLHAHHGLAQEFAVKGLHFQETDSARATTTAKHQLVFSTSFHTLEAPRQPHAPFDYAFLSPIFQSISKKDYPAAFDLDAVRAAIPKSSVPLIALGGITVGKLAQVQALAFAGAAVLGAVWEHPKPLQAFEALRQRCALVKGLQE
ncbi:thiamine phosphate synthase [Pontibacter sp. CAU 1760]